MPWAQLQRERLEVASVSVKSAADASKALHAAFSEALVSCLRNHRRDFQSLAI